MLSISPGLRPLTARSSFPPPVVTTEDVLRLHQCPLGSRLPSDWEPVFHNNPSILGLLAPFCVTHFFLSFSYIFQFYFGCVITSNILKFTAKFVFSCKVPGLVTCLDYKSIVCVFLRTFMDCMKTCNLQAQNGGRAWCFPCLSLLVGMGWQG